MYTKSASGLAGTRGQTRALSGRFGCTGDVTRVAGSRALSGAPRSAFSRAIASQIWSPRTIRSIVGALMGHHGPMIQDAFSDLSGIETGLGELPGNSAVP